jgi:hypothetical protein
MVGTTIDALSGLAAHAAAVAARATLATRATGCATELTCKRRAEKRSGGVLRGDAWEHVDEKQQLASGRPVHQQLVSCDMQRKQHYRRVRARRARLRLLARFTPPLALIMRP